MGTVRRLGAIVAAAALFVLPAGAAQAARNAQPLVSAAPLSTSFKDRLIIGAPARARASRGGITVSPAYANGAAIAGSYAAFLQSLPHGEELDDLRLTIATPEEVEQMCGGIDGMSACYVVGDQRMIVPGEPPPNAPGVTVSYLMAHEYGHHLSAYRDNSPFRALDVGPKYWASHERVCARSMDGRLAPGNERERYRSNPAEAWAEVYARLTYPELAWKMTPLLEPHEETFAAAILDVAAPWTAPRELAFTGRFGEGGSGERTFRLPARLDGTVDLKIDAEAAMKLSVSLRAAGGKRSTRGRRLSATVCRRSAAERIMVTVRRRQGTGPFTLRATYPG